ncbi:hypothetical protein OA381_01000 [Rhodospirillaceae bacterium]|nr:hypothetical protein [Rhodospirillaceae bacterium]
MKILLRNISETVFVNLFSNSFIVGSLDAKRLKPRLCLTPPFRMSDADLFSATYFSCSELNDGKELNTFGRFSPTDKLMRKNPESLSKQDLLPDTSN